MSFASEWLVLREPYDARARNSDVLAAVAAAFASQSATNVVDLACGTGATLRAVAPRLPARQSWRLVDNDLGLLGRASASAHPPGTTVTTTPLDLARDVEAALDGALDLVTTSALLDLVSAEWLERLVVEVAARRLQLYAALTYDGRIELTPADPFDTSIVVAFNRHQRTDKGFGPALGPDAAASATRQLAIVQYEVTQGASDWVFGAQDGAIQNEVLAGWATAAREIGEPLDDVVSWLTRRRDLVAAGRSSMRVGHIDVFARPSATR